MDTHVKSYRDEDPPVPLTAPQVLLLAADTVYGDPRETTPAGQRWAQHVINSILSAARARGFQQERTLRKLLKKNRPTPRVVALAKSACDAAGSHALREIFDQARLTPSVAANPQSLQF